MKILIISGSPRKGGNTELLAEAFAKGASKHHQVEIVSVRDYKVMALLLVDAASLPELFDNVKFKKVCYVS